MTTCPSCRSDDLIIIDIAPRGRTMTFHTCRDCEHKWWMDAEVALEIGLDEVIGAVSAS